MLFSTQQNLISAATWWDATSHLMFVVCCRCHCHRGAESAGHSIIRLNHLSSATYNVIGLWPLSVDCLISSPSLMIAASLLCRDLSRWLQYTDTVVGSRRNACLRRHWLPYRNCVVCGWHFESHLLQFSTCPILLVYLPSALCLVFTSQPTTSRLPTQCCRRSLTRQRRRHSCQN